jgi:hypothetical protein
MPQSGGSHAERWAALTLIEPHAASPQLVTLGANKGYDSADFVMALRDKAVTPHSRSTPVAAARRLTQLRRFEHFKVPKWLRLLRPTPKGRHYSGIGGTGPAVILGDGWAGSSSLSFFSNRLSSGSGSV